MYPFVHANRLLGGRYAVLVCLITAYPAVMTTTGPVPPQTCDNARFVRARFFCFVDLTVKRCVYYVPEHTP